MDGFPIGKTVSERWNSLAPEQKVSAAILGICGIVAFGFSIQRLGAGISDPFTVSKARFQSAKQVIATLDPEKEKEAHDKRVDTDGDGISDWEEVNVLHSNPYLASSAGDGVPDNVKIMKGEDPNCPENKPCAIAGSIDLSVIATSTPFLDPSQVQSQGDQLYAAFQAGANDQRSKLQQDGASSTTPGLQQQLLRDPAAIRKVLADSGQITAQDLAKITDQQLLDLYDRASTELAKQQLDTPLTPTSTPIVQPPQQ